MKNILSIVLIFVIVVVSFCGGYVLYSTVSYGNNGLYIYDYSNSSSLGYYIINYAYGVMNKLSALASGIDAAVSVLIPHPVDVPPIEGLSVDDECGVYRVKESDGSYSYIVFARKADVYDDAVIIFNNSRLFSSYGVGTFINCSAPITNELWISKRVANFYVVDSMSQVLLDEDGKKISLASYYSFFRRRGPQYFTISEAEEKFSIVIIGKS